MSRRARIAGWIVTALAGVVYLAMLVWTLPRLTVAGLPPFDMRPGGYGLDEARAYLAALGPDGAAFYADVQQALDTAFPPLRLAMLVFLVLLAAGRAARLGPAPPRAAVAALLAAAVAGPVFDLLENAAVADLLVAGPDGVLGDGVRRASRLTVAKSVADAVAMSGLLVLVLLPSAAAALRRLRNRP